jgi:UDP-N-acetylglucosamine/UDP-N-acetylgalactosamine diphosphorylase
MNKKIDSMQKIEKLIDKGVRIDAPESVEIGEEVDPSRISGNGVRIYSGCRIFGADTLILPEVKLGYEAPVTVHNCQLGPKVELRGGYFKNAVFLGKNQAGLGSHVREATIFEEQANIAHTVALKQTILFPFVTLGSLINFCDCLMAGGTDRKNHSEVGSSYIHFNFTPNQDKATASLIGDVPRGVMLNQNPIFLGGQGGMVGPCRLGFGITVAAGTIVRKDEPRSDRLIMGGAAKEGNIAFRPGVFRNNKRIILNNIRYIANLIALRHWYDQVRSLFTSDLFPPALLLALQEKADLAIEERINRLEAVCLKEPFATRKDPVNKTLKQPLELNERWPEIKNSLKLPPVNSDTAALRDQFLVSVQRGISNFGQDYIRVIQSLDSIDSEKGTRWLQGIIDDILAAAKKIMPSFF